VEAAFKTTETLFNKILRDFSSYDNANLIDEGEFYTDVKYILTLLGLAWFRPAEEILDISNYKCDLPDDFKLCDAIYKCDRSIYNESLQDGIVLKKRTFDHYPSISNPDTHVGPCDGCTPTCDDSDIECIFNRQEEILVQRSNIIHRYSKPTLLRPGNVSTRRDCCTKNCQNIHSTNPDNFIIQNNKIYTNFKEGHIYLYYHAFPLDEDTGLPLIPDNPIIEKCIEDYIKYNLIKVLLTNKHADLAQIFPIYKADHEKSLGQAIYETKLPTFSTMLNKIRLQRKSLDVYYQLTDRNGRYR